MSGIPLDNEYAIRATLRVLDDMALEDECPECGAAWKNGSCAANCQTIKETPNEPL